MARIAIVDAAAFADTSAGRIADLIETSITAHGRASLALTGGSTPRETYRALADSSRPWRAAIDWSRVHLFWGDERHVPPDHEDSNYGMAFRALVQHVPVPPSQIHRMRGELADASQAAAEYARELPAVFDVMLLGLGDDCHIASIFPGSELLADFDRQEGLDDGGGSRTDAPTRANDQRVAAVFAPHLNAWRITVTPPVILNSRAIVMLVTGEKKAPAVTAAIDAPLDVARYPGQMLRVARQLEWVLDDSAASTLS